MKGTLDIRPAGLEDIQAILDIWNPVLRDDLATFNPVEKTPEDIADMIAQKSQAGHPLLVGLVAGQVAGFATYGAFRNGMGYAHTMEHTIYLAPSAQGRGLGRALMQALETMARGAGVHSLFAGISAANSEGQAFHTAMGYTQVATLKEVGRKKGVWLDLVLMQKFLT